MHWVVQVQTKDKRNLERLMWCRKITGRDERLLKWYEDNGRAFSWRSDYRTPYEILVAEVLLQKTQASAVEKVYENFLENFPTIEELAASRPNEVKFYLSRLGLQERRSKWLIEIARKVVEEFNGQVPREEKEIKKLPGIGLYIGNAILCFAFDERVPILDSNTSRIIGRVHSIDYEGDLRRNEKLKQAARDMLPDERVKEFNWALLDLGALACKSSSPRCSDCPIQGTCSFNDKKDDQEK